MICEQGLPVKCRSLYVLSIFFNVTENSLNLSEQIIQLALQEFQKTLCENLKYNWKLIQGSPPKHAYVEQKEYSTKAWYSGVALRAWSITADSIELLTSHAVPTGKRKINGMFYDLLIGSFSVADDLSCISINWQTGPRYGRGFIHLIERDPDGTLSLGIPKSTWMS